jgi:hypothetical protein
MAGAAAGQLDQTVTLTGRLTGRLLWQYGQRLAGNRSIPDQVVSLADPISGRPGFAKAIAKGSDQPRSPLKLAGAGKGAGILPACCPLLGTALE